MKKQYLCLFMLLMSFSFLSAQSDSTITDDGFDEERFQEDENESYYNLEFPFNLTSTYPTIELNYGFSKPMSFVRGFNSVIAQNGMIDGSLGSTSFSFFKDSTIEEYSYNSIGFKHSSFSLSNKIVNPNAIEIDLTSFSIASADGYAYKIGDNQRIILYNQSAAIWSWQNWNSNKELSNLDSCALNVYGSDVRFGEQFKAGIQVQVIRNFAINASYERDMIFPRHLFWYWSGSQIINQIGSGLIGAFVDEIADSSPNLVPVVNFVLQNAYQYAMFELYKKDMNWPFETVETIQYEHLKIGFSFLF